MIVYINNTPKELPPLSKLSDAIADMLTPGKAVATAVNGKVVPAVDRPNYSLKEGDKILLLKAFYGG